MDTSHFVTFSSSSELQLKARHQPYKLCRQWQDLLYRFTEASEEDISQGELLVHILLRLCAYVTTIMSAFVVGIMDVQ